MKQNLSTLVHGSSMWFSHALFGFWQISSLSDNLKVPWGDAISGNKTWPFTDRGYRSLESGFLLESPSTYRRPSPSACLVECLETRGCIVVFIQWNAQYGSPLIATKLEMENGTRRDGRFPCNVLIAFRMLSIFLPGTNTRRSIISVTMIFAVRKHVHIFISYPKKNLYAIAQHCYTQRMILLKYLKRLNTHRYLKIILLDYQNNYLTSSFIAMFALLLYFFKCFLNVWIMLLLITGIICVVWVCI